MSERTAMYLAILSHGFTAIVFLGVCLFGILTYLASRAEKRAIARGDIHAQRKSAFFQRCSAVLLCCNFLLFLVAGSHYGCAVMKAHSSQCMVNLRNLATAANIYAQDYDETLPAASRWPDAIEFRLLAAQRSTERPFTDPFHCPAADSAFGYGMNRAMGGVKLDKVDEPASTVLLFDTDAPARAFAGGVGDVAQMRHLRLPGIAFADGHAKNVPGVSLNKLRWLLQLPNEP